MAAASAKEAPAAAHFLAGSVAGFTSTVALQPFEVVKTRTQMAWLPSQIRKDTFSATGVRIPRPSYLHFARLTFQQDGIAGLWRGTGAAIARVVPGAGLYFFLLKQLRQDPATHGPSTGVHLMLSGAVARAIASTVLCPVTVVKTRMEASSCSYRSTWHGLSSIAATEGVPGLYRGLVASVMRDAPHAGLHYLFYTNFKTELLKLSGNGASGVALPAIHLASAASAGCISTFLTHPFDVVKTRLQLQRLDPSAARYTGIVHAVQTIVREEGPATMLRGFAPRVIRRSIASGISWTLYEHVVTVADRYAIGK